MTKRQIIHDFMQKSVFMIVFVAIIYNISKGSSEPFFIWIGVGIPFGIWRMSHWYYSRGDYQSGLMMFLLNFIIGGAIGVFFIAVYFVKALYHISITIHELIECRHINENDYIWVPSFDLIPLLKSLPYNMILWDLLFCILTPFVFLETFPVFLKLSIGIITGISLYFLLKVRYLGFALHIFWGYTWAEGSFAFWGMDKDSIQKWLLFFVFFFIFTLLHKFSSNFMKDFRSVIGIKIQATGESYYYGQESQTSYDYQSSDSLSEDCTHDKEYEKQTLKKFYRILAKQFHPDVNHEDDTTKTMQVLNKLKDDWNL